MADNHHAWCCMTCMQGCRNLIFSPHIDVIPENTWKHHGSNTQRTAMRWRMMEIWNKSMKHEKLYWIYIGIYWIIIQFNIRTYSLEWCSTSTYININQLNVQYIYGCKNLLSIPKSQNVMPRPPKRCPEAEARDLPSEVPCMWHDQSRDMNEIPGISQDIPMSFNDVPWRCSTVFFFSKEILEHHCFSGECAGSKVIITSEAWHASNVWHRYQTYRKTWQFSAVHLARIYPSHFCLINCGDIAGNIVRHLGGILQLDRFFSDSRQHQSPKAGWTAVRRPLSRCSADAGLRLVM